MRYFVRRGDLPPYVGPLTAEEIDAAIARGEFGGLVMVAEAAGQTAEQLATATEWKAWTSTVAPPAPSSPAISLDEWSRRRAREMTLERLRAKSSDPLVRGWLLVGAWVGIVFAFTPLVLAVDSRRAGGGEVLLVLCATLATVISIGVAFGLACAGLDAVDAILDRATRDTLADMGRR